MGWNVLVALTFPCSPVAYFLEGFQAAWERERPLKSRTCIVGSDLITTCSDPVA